LPVKQGYTGGVMGLRSLRVPVVAVLACACGGGQSEKNPGGGQGGDAAAGGKRETFPARTEAVLAGPLCQSDACRCREGDDDAGSPAAGLKRFEVRLGPSHDALWATVDGMVLHKTAQRQEACFYVDLKPGRHAVAFRGVGDQGLRAALVIAEQGGAEDATWWYRTFDFQCGTPGPCDTETIERWKQEVQALAGKHDPCGSTKVQGMRWETGRMPDRERNQPDELELHLTLNVYKFTPDAPPGSPECDKDQGQDEGAATPDR
jgi:hypothetical protein